MNYYRALIILCSLIYCNTSMGAIRCQYADVNMRQAVEQTYVISGKQTRVLSPEEAKEHAHARVSVRQKVKQAYVISCKKTRALYEKAKAHTQVVAGVVAYLSFEGFGYSRGWDTPLRRLLMPRMGLNDVHACIYGHTQQIAQLTKDYQALQLHYKDLEKQLENEKELTALKLQEQAMIKEFEKYMED